ncbi:pentapeptide repeat-containing protein [Arenibacter sp. F20364]|uniref:pentapeptide repeat-containing protein n=1 Tax=Arenibacter sp. F20364 TaxID=2926415 RepID=UPI001FF586B9|nr:pentapeptide repeat-containing protein [Arenibacter sp. F20364]MCK0190964.1 pentapeptide repeat-containing protein [Arenibacter sp. F20364]
MNTPFITDRSFKGMDFTTKRLEKGEYENCVFDSCSFSKGDISNIAFMECIFTDCDLSNVNLKNTTFKEVVFKRSKLLGIHFDHCNDFLLSFNFHDCTLDLSSFYKLKLKNTIFNNCKMISVEFTETDLTETIFDSCNLEGALFENCNLEKVDFRTALNYSLDPEKNKIAKAKFSKEGALGLLKKYNIQIT